MTAHWNTVQNLSSLKSISWEFLLKAVIPLLRYYYTTKPTSSSYIHLLLFYGIKLNFSLFATANFCFVCYPFFPFQECVELWYWFWICSHSSTCPCPCPTHNITVKHVRISSESILIRRNYSQKLFREFIDFRIDRRRIIKDVLIPIRKWWYRSLDQQSHREISWQNYLVWLWYFFLWDNLNGNWRTPQMLTFCFFKLQLFLVIKMENLWCLSCLSP